MAAINRQLTREILADTLSAVAADSASRVLTTTELSERLSVPESTLQDWRGRNIGPPWIKMGKHVRYPVTDLATWINKQPREGGDR